MGNPLRLWMIGLILSVLAVALTLLLRSPLALEQLSPLITPLIARLLTLPGDLSGWAGRILTEIILTLLFGGLTLLLLGGRTGQTLEIAQAQPMRAALFGLGGALTALTFPVLADWAGSATGLLMSIAGAEELGRAIAVLVGQTSAGLGGLALIAMLLGGRFVSALVLAVLIIPERWGQTRRTMLTRLLFATGLITVIGIIPFFGWLISLLFALVGTGAFIRALISFTPMQGLSSTTDPARLPPPPIEDRPAAPGMDNLPSGFTWWE